MKIVIPIFDQEGRFLYNKYRQDPNTKIGPKYMYDKGAACVLFNSHTIKNGQRIIITEGEFDALTLESNGYTAVSSTGGAGTFREDWIHLFEGKEVFLCYDSDPVGIQGAIRTSTLLPHAKVINLPYKETCKDVTDFFNTTEDAAHKFEELIDKAQTLHFPKESIEIPKARGKIKIIMIEFRDEIERYVKIRREIENDGKDTMVVNAIIDYLEGRHDYYEHINILMSRRVVEYDNKDMLAKAKTFRVENLIRVNGAGFARCIWHKDANPSMKFYEKTNSVYCFVCRKSGDSIDVYRALNDCSTAEAIKNLQ